MVKDVFMPKIIGGFYAKARSEAVSKALQYAKARR
jgi:hypothetical protein